MPAMDDRPPLRAITKQPQQLGAAPPPALSAPSWAVAALAMELERDPGRDGEEARATPLSLMLLFRCAADDE